MRLSLLTLIIASSNCQNSDASIGSGNTSSNRVMFTPFKSISIFKGREMNLFCNSSTFTLNNTCNIFHDETNFTSTKCLDCCEAKVNKISSDHQGNWSSILDSEEESNSSSISLEVIDPDEVTLEFHQNGSIISSLYLTNSTDVSFTVITINKGLKAAE